MGLDTYLESTLNSDMENDSREEICYWRKCWGVNNWLRENSTPVGEMDYYRILDTAILKDAINSMRPRIEAMLKICKEKNYVVENDFYKHKSICDLYSLICDIEDDTDTIKLLNKQIKGFKFKGLTYDVFEDCIWSALLNFVRTYNEFLKAIKYDKVYFLESY